MMASDASEATIRSANISAFRIPTDQPESDGTAKWDSTTVVLIELTAADAIGLGFSYANVAAAHVAQQLIEKIVLGRNALDIPSLHSALDIEVRNWGRGRASCLLRFPPSTFACGT